MTDSKTEGSGAIEFIRDCGAAGKHRVQLACVFVGQDSQPTRADRADLAAAGYVPKAELARANLQLGQLQAHLETPPYNPKCQTCRMRRLTAQLEAARAVIEAARNVFPARLTVHQQDRADIFDAALTAYDLTTAEGGGD